MPASSACARSTRAQKPWMVEIQADSTPAAASGMPSSRSRSRIRRFSSSAARSVKVITSRWSSGVPSCSRRATRSISTDVLPVPAPAETNTRPRRSIAARLAGVPAAPAHRSTRQMPPAWRRHHSGQVPPIGSRRTSPRRTRATISLA